MIEIIVDKYGSGYAASVKVAGRDCGLYPGASPDEALGHAIRELWLAEEIPGITLHMRSE